jgi:hypothetical protein
LYSTDIAFSFVRGQFSSAHYKSFTKDKTIPDKVNTRTPGQRRDDPCRVWEFFNYPMSMWKNSQNPLAVISAMPKEETGKTRFRLAPRPLAGRGGHDRKGPSGGIFAAFPATATACGIFPCFKNCPTVS